MGKDDRIRLQGTLGPLAEYRIGGYRVTREAFEDCLSGKAVPLRGEDGRVLGEAVLSRAEDDSISVELIVDAPQEHGILGKALNAGGSKYSVGGERARYGSEEHRIRHYAARERRPDDSVR